MMHRKCRSVITIALLTACSIAARAQDSSRTNDLNEVVVTATKFAKKAGETGKVITVLTQEYLQKNSGKPLTSILNSQAGMVVNGAENASGTNQDVYMRGAATGNTLVLIDGIPVNDASQISNAFDLNFLPTSQIERIEILRGGQSTLYGSDAVAGVVNIITKKPGNKPFGANANFSYGSYDTWRAGAGVNGSAGKFSYMAGYQYNRSQGFSAAYDSTGQAGFDKDGFKRNSVFAKLGLQATSRWKLQYLLQWSDYHADVDASGFTDDKDYVIHNKYLMNAISSRYNFNRGSWFLVYNYQQNKRDLLNDTIFKPGYYYHGMFESNTHQVETYVHWDVTPELQLIAGADFRTSNTDQSAIPAYAPDLSGDSAHARQFSHYASLLLHNVGGFNLEVGGRFNYHNIYGNNQTISFNPSYLLNDHHKLFINISSGYKVPTLYQLYSEFGYKDLLPESSVSYEAGYQAALCDDKLNLRVAGFQRDMRNLIIFNSPLNQYRNANKQHDYGVELETNWNITKGLDLGLNYTYTDGRVKEQEKDTSYYNLYRRPKHAVNVSLGYQLTPALYISAQYKYIAKRWEGMFQAPPIQMGDYYTLDAYAEYMLAGRLRIYADIRNITDQQYFDIRGYNSRKFNFTTGLVFNL